MCSVVQNSNIHKNNRVSVVVVVEDEETVDTG
jgi:hypothetical protein